MVATSSNAPIVEQVAAKIGDDSDALWRAREVVALVGEAIAKELEVFQYDEAARIAREVGR